MKSFVTGASGLIGSHVVRQLLDRGHEVKALVRSSKVPRSLAGLDIELVKGDISDGEALAKAISGCDWCFHAAACYRLWLPDYKQMQATNVEGTRNVLAAAMQAGCERVVYTSTVGCIGAARMVNGSVVPSDENTLLEERDFSCAYKRTKWQAEEVALEFARKGLPIVIVNPATTIGPGDYGPTPSGKVILDFLNRKMPCYLDTGLNWVHVRDVATGHILAAERGRIGERYILGNAKANFSLKAALEVLSQFTGLPAPRLQIPYMIAFAAAQISEAAARVSGTTPRVPLGGVRMARDKMYFNPEKAIRELGMPQARPEEALHDAATWFREAGMASW